VRWLILLEGAWLALLGIVIGLAGAVAAAQAMRGLVCEYTRYDELPVLLNRFRRAIAEPDARATNWSFDIGSGSYKGELHIVREDAPSTPRPREEIAVVARRDPNSQLPQLPHRYSRLARDPQFIGDHTVKYGNTTLYALTARCRGNEEDDAVDDAVREFLEYTATSK
jgi:hypothetical protein